MCIRGELAWGARFGSALQGEPGLRAGQGRLGLHMDLGTSHVKQTRRAAVHGKGVLSGTPRATHLEGRRRGGRIKDGGQGKACSPGTLRSPTPREPLLPAGLGTQAAKRRC